GRCTQGLSWPVVEHLRDTMGLAHAPCAARSDRGAQREEAMNPVPRRLILIAPFLVVLAGCAAPAVPDVPAGPDPILVPNQVRPGQLEYAPDRSTFAPILTEGFAYPTQAEANAAYHRLLAAEPSNRPYPSSIWLFGCKPGALDQETARLTRYPAPVV